MGKNQLFKAVQRAKHVAALDGSMLETEDGTVDASFHTPEWHAARLSMLQHRRMSWEEYKEKIKEDEGTQSKLHELDEQLTMKYREQLKADREKRMGRSTVKSTEKKERERKKRKHDKKNGIKKSREKKPRRQERSCVEKRDVRCER